MGSRGAFEDVNTGNFTFIDGGQTFNSIGEVDGVKVLVRTSGSVKAPEYSHTENRTYAIVQDGQLKHLTFYDEKHKQSVSIDLLHEHGSKRLKPHKHYNLDHTDDGIPVSENELKLINKIRRRFNLK
ncbi:MAG: hypothetical protein II359_03525 [Clostridia bacterium]|nr:hypothetical protein [Clostridia bacterium]